MNWLPLLFLGQCVYASNPNKKTTLEGRSALTRMIYCLDFLACNTKVENDYRRYDYLENPIDLAEYYLTLKQEQDLAIVESIFLFEVIGSDISKLAKVRHDFGEKVANLVDTRINYHTTGKIKAEELGENFKTYFKQFVPGMMVKERYGKTTLLITLLAAKTGKGTSTNFHAVETFLVGSEAYAIYRWDKWYFTLSINIYQKNETPVFRLYQHDLGPIKKTIVTKITDELFVKELDLKTSNCSKTDKSNIELLVVCLKFVLLQTRKTSNTAGVSQTKNNVVPAALRLVHTADLEVPDIIFASILFYSLDVTDYNKFVNELTQIGKTVPAILAQLLLGIDTETQWNATAESDQEILKEFTRMKEIAVSPEATVIAMADILGNILTAADSTVLGDEGFVEFVDYAKIICKFYSEQKETTTSDGHWDGKGELEKAFDRLTAEIRENCSA